MHLTVEDLESLGRDLCRSLLIYSDLYIPPEFSFLAADKALIGNKNLTENLDKKKLYTFINFPQLIHF